MNPTATEWSPLDHIWTPLLGRGHLLTAALASVLLAVAVTAGLWTIRGVAATGRERRMRRGIWFPGRVLDWTPILVPILAVPCVFLLLAPLRQQVSLALVSRSRLPRSDDAWDRAWAEEAKTWPVPTMLHPLWDAGPVVDAVCRRLAAEPPAGGWRRDDPESLDALAQSVRRSLREPGPGPKPVNSPAQIDRSVSKEVSTLPRWVVESVELSVLRTIEDRSNVRRLVVLAADRRSALGWTWNQAEAYFAADPSGRRPPEVRIVKVNERPALWLEPGAEATIKPGELVVHALVSARPRLPNEPESDSIDLEVKGTGIAPGELKTPMKLLLDYGPRLHPVRLSWPLRAGAKPLSLDAPGNSVPFGRSVGESGLTVRVIVPTPEDEARWLTTLDIISKDPAFLPWLERIKDWGLSFSPKNFAVTVADRSVGSENVLVDASQRGILWVAPNNKSWKPPPSGPTPAPRGSSPPLRGRVADGTIPGRYSWQNVPVVPSSLVIPTPPPPFASEADRVALYLYLNSGESINSGVAPAPLISVGRVTMDGEKVASRVAAFASGPAEQGALLEKTGVPTGAFDLARFCAYWTALLEAIRAAADREAVVTDTAEMAGDHPQSLVDGDHLSVARADGLSLTMTLVLIALGFYAVFILRGVVSSRGYSRRPAL